MRCSYLRPWGVVVALGLLKISIAIQIAERLRAVRPIDEIQRASRMLCEGCHRRQHP